MGSKPYSTFGQVLAVFNGKLSFGFIKDIRFGFLVNSIDFLFEWCPKYLENLPSRETALPCPKELTNHNQNTQA